MRKLLCIVAATLIGLTSCAPYATNVIGYGNYWYVLPQPVREHYPIGSHGIYWETRGWTLKVNEYGYIDYNDIRLGQMKVHDELEVTWEGEVYLNGKRIDHDKGL